MYTRVGRLPEPIPKITLIQFADKMGLHPSMITRTRKKDILDEAIVPVEGKKRVLINLAKGKKLYDANHDPNFRKSCQCRLGLEGCRRWHHPFLRINYKR